MAFQACLLGLRLDGPRRDFGLTQALSEIAKTAHCSPASASLMVCSTMRLISFLFVVARRSMSACSFGLDCEPTGLPPLFRADLSPVSLMLSVPYHLLVAN
jgi:hypothetical protein